MKNILHIFKKHFWILAIVLWFVCTSFASAKAPSFDNNFAKYLTDSTPDQYGRVETVFNICIDRSKSLMENVRNLFYPNPLVRSICGGQTSAGGQLRELIRVIGLGIMFVFVILAGVNFIMDAKTDWPKKAAISLLYISYWAFMIFGVTWLLGVVLNVDALRWSVDLVDKVQNNLFLQILGLFKVLAFFVAILMIVVYGFQMMAAMDKEDKVKAARTGIVNVIISLVFIKIIDYVFYIAQLSDFAKRASDMIIDIAKILRYFVGFAFIVAIFYAWFLLFTSWGKEDAFKKTKSILINIFLVSLVIFLFLLLIYQIFNQFA